MYAGRVRVIAIFLFAAILLAQTQIEGSVFNADRSPVKGAVIHFVRIDRKQREFTIKTNRVGHFGYFDLPGGRYDIKAFAASGELIDERDDVIITGVPVQFDFVVRRKPG
jgi:hypothetical protein